MDWVELLYIRTRGKYFRVAIIILCLKCVHSRWYVRVPIQFFSSPPVALLSLISRFALVQEQIDSNMTGWLRKIWTGRRLWRAEWIYSLSSIYLNYYHVMQGGQSLGKRRTESFKFLASRPYFFLWYSRFGVDLLSYESKATDKRGLGGWKKMNGQEYSFCLS